MYKNLALVIDKEVLEAKEKIIFYGNLSIENQHKLKKENNNIIFFESQKYNYEDRLKKLLDCEESLEIILEESSHILNRINKVNFSKKSWKIILGKWLTDFTWHTFKSFEEIQNLLKKNDIKTIYKNQNRNYVLLTNDTAHLYSAFHDVEWSSKLNSQIINFLLENYQNIDIEQNKVQYNKNYFFKKKNNPLINSLSCLNLFTNENDALIYQSSLSFFDQKKIELHHNKKISSWIKKNIQYQNIDLDLRKKIIFEKVTNDLSFLNFLRKILPLSLPKHVLENFNEINQFSEKMKFPKNPKFILTGNAFNEDEIFKFYLAKKTSFGIPYFVIQHGSVYYTDIASRFRHEVTLPDGVITWGADYDKKLSPTFNTNSILIKKQLTYKNKKNLSVICNPLFSNVRPYMYENFKKIFENNYIFFNNAKEEVAKNIFFKRFPREYTSNDEIFLDELYAKNKINTYSEDETYISVLNKSKLLIYSYESSGFYETLSLNIPTIMLNYEVSENFEMRYKNIIKDLIKSKVIFECPIKLAEHINNYWNNLDEWWLNPETQESINNFNNSLNLPYRNNFDFLLKNIDNLYLNHKKNS